MNKAYKSMILFVCILLISVNAYSVLAETNEEYVESLYNNILGRGSDPDGKQAHLAALQSGALSREQITSNFYNSQEYQNINEGDNNRFVEDLYRGTLRRSSDTDGFNAHFNALESRQLSREQIINNFLNSPEYISNSNEEFVTDLYENVLGRNPDSGGFQHNLALLNPDPTTGQSGISREDMENAFYSSKEYQDNNEADVSFVTNLYNGILGRDPDPTGFGHNLRLLDNEVVDYVGMVDGFLNSPEHIGKSNAEFLEGLYKNILGRESEPEGFQFNLGLLDNREVTREEMTRAFFNSPEYQNRDRKPEQFVTDLYQGILGREPTDQPGFDHNLGLLTDPENPLTRDELIDGFLNSPEYKSKSNEVFLIDLYQGILGRELDPLGFEHNLNLLNTGQVSREEMIDAFINSPEFQEGVEVPEEEEVPQPVYYPTPTGGGGGGGPSPTPPGPTVTVISPNGGETIYGITDILWTAVNGLLSIAIQYSDDAGAIWDTIASGLNNSGSYSWDTLGLSAGSQYLVRVIATDSDNLTGEDTSDDVFTILSSPDVGLSVNIDADKTSGGVPLEVKFDAHVTGGNSPLTYAWDFNNDGIIDCTEKSPKAIFNEKGSYLVSLTVTDVDGDTATDTITINAEELKHIKSPRKKIHINSIGFENDQIRAGEDLIVYVSFENQGNYKIKNDASVTVIIPELSLRQKISHINLKTNKGVTKKLILEVPEDTELGIYDVMIVIYDNGLKRIRYRPIEIIG